MKVLSDIEFGTRAADLPRGFLFMVENPRSVPVSALVIGRVFCYPRGASGRYRFAPGE